MFFRVKSFSVILKLLNQHEMAVIWPTNQKKKNLYISLQSRIYMEMEYQYYNGITENDND